MKQKPQKLRRSALRGYSDLLADISGLLEDARRRAARAVNAVLTATGVKARFFRQCLKSQRYDLAKIINFQVEILRDGIDRVITN